jgi:hypothetical protein
VVVWFPASTLLSQQHQLASLNTEIGNLRASRAAIAAQQKALSTPAAQTRLARAQYQLVKPGDRLIQILPGVNNTNGVGNGDPGNDPVVSPGHTSAPAAAAKANARPGHSLWDRVLGTLEFWR